mmetsp:Transcript_20801/g.30864  ORF Transcript_20801/g.30864 Transcript_20801/m.30864 type:complete len:81 (+) Transcript_20801:44-286(+)
MRALLHPNSNTGSKFLLDLNASTPLRGGNWHSSAAASICGYRLAVDASAYPPIAEFDLLLDAASTPLSYEASSLDSDIRS